MCYFSGLEHIEHYKAKKGKKLLLWVYMCVLTHTYTCVCAHAHIHMHVLTHTCTCVCACTYTCLCMRAHTPTRTESTLSWFFFMVMMRVLNLFLPLALIWLTIDKKVSKSASISKMLRSNQAPMKNVDCHWGSRSWAQGYWKWCCYLSGLNSILQLVWEAKLHHDKWRIVL